MTYSANMSKSGTHIKQNIRNDDFELEKRKNTIAQVKFTYDKIKISRSIGIKSKY